MTTKPFEINSGFDRVSGRVSNERSDVRGQTSKSHVPEFIKAHPNMSCDPWGTHNNNRPWDQKYINYIDDVKKACPEVYAWQFDDFKSTINCRKTGGLVDYKLTLCP